MSEVSKPHSEHIETVRKYLLGRKVTVDHGEGEWEYQTPASARAPLAALDSLEEQLEASQQVVRAAQFYFDEMRAGRPALTIGIEQALNASNPASAPQWEPVEGSGGPVFAGHSYDGRTFYPGKPLNQDRDPAGEPS